MLLDVKDLKTYFYTDEGVVRAVDDLSFQVERGKTLGIVGESGSGKSVSSLSILQLIDSPPGKIIGGSIYFEGKDLLSLSKKEMRKIRGNKISMIFQEPMTALNPVYTVGNQIGESIKLHQGLRGRKLKARILEILELVQMPDAQKRLRQYPHELSGGMRQRVMIAMALSSQPDLLICDEPTTALDVTIQAQILDLINDLKQELNTAIIMITHDFGVISEVSDHVLVMYAGKLVEYGETQSLISNPQHPYTKALLASIPQASLKNQKLHVIQGMVPSLSQKAKGCLFAPRCELSRDICFRQIPREIEKNGQKVACFLYQEEKDEA